MGARRVAGRIAVGALLLRVGAGLGAETLRVPSAYPTITTAVNRASDGDTVLVDDGVYLESNIEITKKILVRSKNLYGAVVYGTKKTDDAIFIVRAAARLEGFILKNAATGIKQRHSPDVEWQVSNIAIYDCSTGIAVDDSSDNVGSASIRNVAIFGGLRSAGISTNDAGRMEVSGCLIANCAIAFQGYDHLSFRVENCAVLDCGQVASESTAHRPIPPATSRIEIGDGLRIMSTGSLSEPGRREECLDYLRAAVFGTGIRKAGSVADTPALDAVVTLTEARIMLRLGEYGLADSRYEKALESSRNAGSEELSWQAIMGLVRTAESGGKATEALARYRDAFDLLEKWAPAVPMGLHRVDFLEDKAPAVEANIGLLLEEHSPGPVEGRVEEAFLCAERYRSLARFMPANAKGRGRDAATALNAISSIQSRLQDPDLGAGAKEDLIRALERAEDDYRVALIEEERTLDGGKYGSPLGFRGVRDRLAGRAVLSYFLGEKESYAFLATEAGLAHARLPAAARIAGMVVPYLRFLQLRNGNDFRGAKAGQLLFDLLVGPFAEKLQAGPQRIIIVPDGQLNYLPFEALVVGGRDNGFRPAFWAASAEISYAPSVTRAVGGPPWSSAGAWKRGQAPDVLAVGNSDGIRCDNRSRNLKRFFLPLAHVREEIRALAGVFSDRKVTTLVDEEAKEARLKTADLSHYGIIHLAAHGVIDDTDWWRSALMLRPDPGSGDDGFFTVLEILKLELRASLVVLSGCGTGTGSLFKGEGIRGLSGAFLRAGAGYLLVSLWNVDDRATAELMGRFYRGLAAGASPARALADAKKRMIDAGYRNPLFWAPFILIENGEDPGQGRQGMKRTARLTR